MVGLKRISLVASAAISLSGCGLWSGSNEIEPQSLVDFEADKSFDVRWSADIGASLGDRFHQLEPTVSGQSIIVADAAGNVTSLEPETGKRIWQVDLDGAIAAGVGFGQETAAIVLDTGELVALSSVDGSENWRTQLTSEVTAAPQIDAVKIVVQQVNGQVAAYDRVTGEKRWAYDAQEPALTLRGTGTPLLLSDGVLAGFANGKVAALAADSGTPAWELRVNEALGRSELERLVDLDGGFTVSGDLVFTGGYQGRVVAINPRTASTVWTQRFSTYQELAAGFGNVYAVDSAGAVEAFDAASSASVWRNSDFANRRLSAPVTLGNSVVVGDAYGYLHALSQVDGRPLARISLDGSAIFADPVVFGDSVYILSNSGKLSALTLK